MQTCDPCVLLQVAFTWHLSGYVLHSSISVKKRKKEKRMKMGFGFHSKVIHVHVYGKSGILVCNFLVSCDSRVGPVSQTAIVQFFFTLIQQRLSKAYAINCSCFATGAQNTLHRQQKKERIKVNHLWPHFLVIPNSPVQFCPFPVYPGWQSHTCDPLGWCSLHSHDKSCFLYTRQRLFNKNKQKTTTNQTNLNKTKRKYTNEWRKTTLLLNIITF